MIIYPETCAWDGALTFAQLSTDKDLTLRLIGRFDPLLAPEGSKRIPRSRNVDNSVFGAVPLEIYMQTKDARYLELGRMIADRQLEMPTQEGLTRETRFWIDDMFMITAVQIQAYRATGAAKYLHRAALEMTVYLDKLQQPNGLFSTHPTPPSSGAAATAGLRRGITEMPRSLPRGHPRRARITQAYRNMMKSLLTFQGGDGMWRQLSDHPEGWVETSSTAMFTFALISGVKNRWLEERTSAPAARKGWRGLVSYSADGDVSDVCEGTNKKNDLQYYLNRAPKTGDLHGQARHAMVRLRPTSVGIVPLCPTLSLSVRRRTCNITFRGIL